jgi:dienelactone hydrolase
LANHEHQVVALDYWQGLQPANIKEAEQKLFSVSLEDLTSVILPDVITRTGVSHLVGMGFGGTLALMVQENMPGIKSVTCCYGLPPAGRVKSVRAPLMVVRATRNRWDDPAHIQAYLDLAPRAQVMNHDCDAEFLNETAASFEFQRLRVTAETISSWVKSNN